MCKKMSTHFDAAQSSFANLAMDLGILKPMYSFGIGYIEKMNNFSNEFCLGL